MDQSAVPNKRAPDNTIDEESYRGYLRLLLWATARLVRQGWPIRPDEALDLVHDFFIDAWPGVKSRFDPRRGRFEPYLYRAYVFYTRRRLDRFRRLRQRTSDVLEARSLAREAKAEEDCELTRVVECELAKLPESSRDVLQAYLEPCAGSERALASQLGMTRYRVRELLTSALGSLALAVSEQVNRKLWGPKLFRAAEALWREGRGVADAARCAGLHRDQVELLKREMLGQLVAVVGNRGRRKTQSGREDDAMKKIGELLEEACTKSDPALIEELRSRAQEVIAFLEDADDEPISKQACAALDRDPVHAAAVIAALGEEPVLTPREQEVLDAAIHAREESEADAGRDLARGLFATLPANLKDWESLFSPRLELDDEARQVLLSRSDMQMAGQEAKSLADFGLTPVSLLYAMQAVREAVDLYEHENPDFNPNDRITLPSDADSTERIYNSLPPQRVVDEIAAMVECDVELARSLLSWLFKVVADGRPNVLPGFYAEVSDQSLLLDRTGGDMTILESTTRQRPFPVSVPEVASYQQRESNLYA